MNNILLGLFFLILGLLFANMLNNICGCKDLVEGQCSESNPCLNGGTCPEGEGVRDCICTDDYMGGNCEIKLLDGDCLPNPCMNEGVCQPIGFPVSSKHYCDCTDDYTGDHCETVSVAAVPDNTVPDGSSDATDPHTVIDTGQAEQVYKFGFNRDNNPTVVPTFREVTPPHIVTINPLTPPVPPTEEPPAAPVPPEKSPPAPVPSSLGPTPGNYALYCDDNQIMFKSQ